MPQAIVLQKIDGKSGEVYYPLKSVSVPKPQPKDNELLIRISAAALNHRDLFLRQHLYPGLAFGVPLLADMSGTVVECGNKPGSTWKKGDRVILTPGRGWDSSPDGPETGAYAILGGTKFNPVGTLQEYVCVEADDVERAPEHLSAAEAAALPLTGLTGWRALVTKSGNAEKGRNILITGIGGGVALMALQFAVAKGVNVWVTSGDPEKIKKAEGLGAKGGVIYKDEGWEGKLADMLPRERKFLDAVIDGAGGDVVGKTVKILKHGGIIVSYGMTLGPKVSFPMSAVLKNIELRGSTMGSRAEFHSMVEFVREKRIKPMVSRVVHGLDIKEIDGLFEDMKTGKQFGKLVIEISRDEEWETAKL